jgi:predicted enzyme related to lactoylglutathione lyase
VGPAAAVGAAATTSSVVGSAGSSDVEPHRQQLGILQQRRVDVHLSDPTVAVGLSVGALSMRVMNFVSTRIITADVRALVEFYEMVTGISAVWANELFAEIPTPVGTLALGSDKTVPLFGAGSAEPAANRSAIVEFIVEDVDAEYERLREHLTAVVTEPTTMPWGNRALLFRDPDGNLVNLFTPVTEEARAKFAV